MSKKVTGLGESMRRVDAIHEAARRRNGSEFLKRPWGGYEVILKTSDYVVKRLIVKPGEATSLQSHEGRAEDWVVVRGSILVTSTWNDDEALYDMGFDTGERIHIDKEQLHRITNGGAEDAHIIEVWTGDDFREDDITRYEDRYGR